MQPFHFTPQEILTYLPCGWRVSDQATHGTWLESRQVWQLRLQDGADVEWLLQVLPKEVADLGRIEALRIALTRLQTEGLG
ncbi:MAG: hypothetical protein V3S30_08790 [Thermoanaerobaculia bacterium]